MEVPFGAKTQTVISSSPFGAKDDVDNCLGGFFPQEDAIDFLGDDNVAEGHNVEDSTGKCNLERAMASIVDGGPIPPQLPRRNRAAAAGV